MALSDEDLRKIAGLFEGRFVGLESTMDSINVRMGALEASNEKLEASSKDIGIRLGALEASNEKLEASSKDIGIRLGALEASSKKIDIQLGDLERTTEVVNRFPYPQEPRRHVHRDIKTHSASGPTYR
ncbi:MAG: hypothetical protein A3H93_15490 [Rhodocyclales bacterium RIFCSPLOWO2_02_FULL_63_24]|nr:MAG: hypothetical protein A3H93_15490 [Rhodocyclales bacterium RIFCSPLOWO2_02_FULL_63_24]